ncbi:2-succinyl-5-enolpyruvyl-6-hydroxy-3-cyclohexene-1-carboxylic-acid synthase [Candidatus Enterovibrio altilux]|uniref:2-succinyl-5-enolpyruvyl-6-hydroxy-3-cyclohexene-1-carboxylate synthase n=1 Tax=Candidatus Enterovibrio altilux TaxID=1927128 RepID=A0A291BAD5_9GAMM|nr:2-succinyl-5-enolpyruvyl-6-hydroxy-3-cyclohexene-1-carboxylic-acid synthase [Candidatus Enterovibrio luxaltus]ATF09947.1 2-succinyl-5-enolpyruvyl-6-hydroxy-3- cyclohexene-1-carboxylic-acid synthase [Candidatus Enterovibrio luxaltus]
MKQSTLNRIWAKLMLMSLQRAGITDICIAPGSRSTPLTLEAEILRKSDDFSLRLHTHFDERGLGFLALGLAKASDKPIAVIVTSGTAVANLLSSVTESHLTREKLILLTADRPTELIQCGANQAISQLNIFGEHVDFSCNLPSPSELISPAWLLSTLDEKLYAQAQAGGSFHINCPFPEPLYGELDIANSYLLPVTAWLESNVRYLTFVKTETKNLWLNTSSIIMHWQNVQCKKGIIITGRLSRKERRVIQVLSKKLGWPLLCDPQSGMGSDFAGFDVWMQNQACFNLLCQTAVIVQFGSRLVSKRLGQFMAKFKGDYWLVDNHPGRLDPRHLQAFRIIGKLDCIAEQLIINTDDIIRPTSDVTNWCRALASASKRYQTMIQEKLEMSASISELAMATDFTNWIDTCSDLFIGNSLVIRLLDMCACLPDINVYANRGASGIDGLIATTSGIQRANQRSMVCLLGDISALYDLNSFALLSQNSHPLVIIVVNNNGGGIFDMLPVPQESKDALYRMPHGFEFLHAAAMFGLGYSRPITLEEGRRICLEGQKKPGTLLMEICVPAGESGEQLKTLFSDVASATLIN